LTAVNAVDGLSDFWTQRWYGHNDLIANEEGLVPGNSEILVEILVPGNSTSVQIQIQILVPGNSTSVQIQIQILVPGNSATSEQIQIQILVPGNSATSVQIQIQILVPGNSATSGGHASLYLVRQSKYMAHV
jgi:uncharacterized membrane protein